MAVACFIHDGPDVAEVVHRFEVQAPRVLAHPNRRNRWLECGAAPERELDVANEAAA
jgi:hypothetical protein